MARAERLLRHACIRFRRDETRILIATLVFVGCVLFPTCAWAWWTRP